jgi:hypothetical protein
MPRRSPGDIIVKMPEPFVAAARLQAEWDAESLCRSLDILAEVKGFEHLKAPTEGMSLGWALGLAAATHLYLWPIHGLSASFPERPPLGLEMMTWLLKGPTAGAEADRRGLIVYRYYFAVWSSRFAWRGAAELGADILVDRASQLTDSELDLLADFLWACRRI